jgi:hypothetical protein
MKKHLFTFVASLAFQAATMAASGVSVHVMDPQHRPIAGAVVTLTSRNAERWTATTDAAGACTFAAPAAGAYFLGSSSNLDPVSSRAFRFPGPSRAQTAVSYRRPLREFSAVRFYLKADNLFNQTYFENGYRIPGVGVTAATQWEF